MQINRLFEIIYYLLGKKRATAQELADRLGVSRRTIFRDIDVLSLSGIPVYTERGSGGGIQLMEGFVLNKSVLSEREQNEILSALHGLATVKTEETGSVLQKMGELFAKEPPNWFEVDFSSWGHGSGGHFFPSIKTAIFEKRVVEFDYYNSRGDKSHRRAEPIQLRFKSRAWYFKGYCLEKGEIRLFKMTRVKNLVVTQKPFLERELPGGPPMRENGKSPEGCREDVTLVMKIAPQMAYRIYDEYEEDQVQKHADGSFTATITYPEDNWLYGFILSFGVYAEVLDPKHIREVIKELSLKIAGKY